MRIVFRPDETAQLSQYVHVLDFLNQHLLPWLSVIATHEYHVGCDMSGCMTLTGVIRWNVSVMEGCMVTPPFCKHAALEWDPVKYVILSTSDPTHSPWSHDTSNEAQAASPRPLHSRQVGMVNFMARMESTRFVPLLPRIAFASNKAWMWMPGDWVRRRSDGAMKRVVSCVMSCAGHFLAAPSGAGKTAAMLALCAACPALMPRTPKRPTLIVVPSDLVKHWVSEHAHTCPQLRLKVCTTLNQMHGSDNPSWADADIVLTTYNFLELRSRECVRVTNWHNVSTFPSEHRAAWHVPFLLVDVAWERVVFDHPVFIGNLSDAALGLLRYLHTTHTWFLARTARVTADEMHDLIRPRIKCNVHSDANGEKYLKFPVRGCMTAEYAWLGQPLPPGRLHALHVRCVKVGAASLMETLMAWQVRANQGARAAGKAIVRGFMETMVLADMGAAIQQCQASGILPQHCTADEFLQHRPDNQALAAALACPATPCSICLAHCSIDRVVLPCDHMYCCTCILAWLWKPDETEPASCPLCRRHIDSLADLHLVSPQTLQSGQTGSHSTKMAWLMRKLLKHPTDSFLVASLSHHALKEVRKALLACQQPIENHIFLTHMSTDTAGLHYPHVSRIVLLECCAASSDPCRLTSDTLRRPGSPNLLASLLVQLFEIVAVGVSDATHQIHLSVLQLEDHDVASEEDWQAAMNALTRHSGVDTNQFKCSPEVSVK
jgi:hypothetical protein